MFKCRLNENGAQTHYKPHTQFWIWFKVPSCQTRSHL